MSRSVAGWAFGMSISILFLALWGRAVVIDTDALAESMSPLASADIVGDYVADWMTQELLESGADTETVGPTVDTIFRSSTITGTMDQLVEEVVYAAASMDPGGSTIDMAALIGPAVPEVSLGLNGLGYPVPEGALSDVVGGLDPLVIRQPGTTALIGPGSPTVARLGTAALLAALSLVVFGLTYVTLSEDRIGSVRHLMTRVAVGGVSFAVFLRLGSWVVDPSGGRAPVRETVSALAGSKWAQPLEVAAVAGLIAAGIYVGRRLIIRGEGFLRSGEAPKQLPVRSKSRSGSR